MKQTRPCYVGHTIKRFTLAFGKTASVAVVTLAAASQANTAATLSLDTIPGSASVLSDTISISYTFTDNESDGHRVDGFRYSVGDTTAWSYATAASLLGTTYNRPGTHTFRWNSERDFDGCDAVPLYVSFRLGDSIWTARTSMTTARSQLASVATGSHVYALGGLAAAPVATAERFDPAANAWTTMSAMPTARYALAAAVNATQVHAIGGIAAVALSTHEVLDPATGTWSSRAAMPTARYLLAAATVNGTIYAMGGTGAAGALATVEQYDPVTDTWTSRRPMPTARYGLGVTVIDGRIYAIGGRGVMGDVKSTVEIYDPATDSWTTGAAMPTARCYLGVTAIDGRVYAVGGWAGNTVSAVEEYDPALDLWLVKAALPTPRWGLGVSSFDGNLLAVGGTAAPGASKVAEMFRPPVYSNWVTSKALSLDNTTPAVVAIVSPNEDGIYEAGDRIDLTVRFTEPVTLAGGLLRIALETGLVDHAVEIAAIDNAAEAHAVYTVLPGDVSADLSILSLTLSAGSIADAGGNDVVLAIPAGANLNDTRSIVIDAQAPTSPTISITDQNGTSADATPALVLSAVNADSMRFSVNHTGWSDWVAYRTSWTDLDISTGGDGLKRVCVQYKDLSGDESLVACDSTLYTAPAPRIVSIALDTAIQDLPYEYVTLLSYEGARPVVTFQNLPSWVTVSGDTARGVLVDPIQDTGFTVIATQGTKADTLNVYIKIIRNKPPLFCELETCVPRDQAIVGLLYQDSVWAVGQDCDDWVTYGMVSAPTTMRLDTATGAIAWVPTSRDTGKHIIVVEATDRWGAKDSTWFQVFVIAYPLNVRITNLSTAQYPMITVTATVTDHLNRPLTSLAPVNFRLTEDNEPVAYDWRFPQGVSVSLVIDRSNSMGGTYIDSAKSAAKTFVQLKRRMDRVALVTFSNTVRVEEEITYDSLAIQDAIRGITTGGATAILDGAYEGVRQLLHETNLRAVIVLSDDGDNSSVRSLDSVVALANQAGVAIYTIGLGNNTDPVTLFHLADRTGGMFLQAPTANDLEDLFRLLRGVFDSQYMFTYETPDQVMDGGSHEVILGVDYDSYHDEDTAHWYEDNPQGGPCVCGGPPTITHLPGNTCAIRPATACPVSAKVTSAFPLVSVDLYCRPVESTSCFVVLPMASVNGTFTAQIPANQVGRKGTEFFIAATNEVYLTSVWPGSCSGVAPQRLYVNGAPVIVESDCDTAIEEQLFTHLLQASDPDECRDDGITWSFANLPAWLSYMADPPRLTGTPDDPVADAAVTVTATDRCGATDRATLCIPVVPVNDAPCVTSPRGGCAIEGSTFSYTGSATDVDNAQLSVSFEDVPDWADTTGAVLSGTPEAGGADCEFTVVASDGITETRLPVAVRVSCAPRFVSPQADSATEEQPYTYVAESEDDDEGDSARITFVNLPSWLTANGDSVSGTPDDPTCDTCGATFGVVATDRCGLTATLQVRVGVCPVNDAPRFVNCPDSVVFTYNGAENNRHQLTATDPDLGDTIRYSLGDGAPSGLVIDSLSGMLSWPQPRSGIYMIDAFATDGAGASDTCSFPLIVWNLCVIIYDTTTEGDTYSHTMRRPCGFQAITEEYTSVPKWCTVSGLDVSGTSYAGAPDDALHYRCFNGFVWYSYTVVLTVNGPPCIASPASDSATEQCQFTYEASYTDPDSLYGDTMRCSFVGLPSWLSANGNTVSGTPDDPVADACFKVMVVDRCRLADTLDVSVKVKPVNDPPKITSAAADTANETEHYEYLATACDPDDAPVLSFRDFPGWMDTAGAVISGTAPAGTPDTCFTVIASDGRLSDMLKVTLVVNGHPVTVSDTCRTAVEESLFTYTPAAIDPDSAEGDIPRICFANVPAWMDTGCGGISGTPDDPVAETAFTVIATDRCGLRDTLTVCVPVVPVNDPPVITSPCRIVVAEEKGTDYLATAIDPDDVPVLSFENIPSWLDTTGAVFSGTPAMGTPDTTVRVIVTDGRLHDTLDVTIIVCGAPVIESLEQDTAFEKSLYVYVPAATDPQGGPLSYAYSELPSWLTAHGDTLSGTPDDPVTDTTFRLVATNGCGLRDERTVEVALVPRNDPPEILFDPVTDATVALRYDYQVVAIDPDGDTVTHYLPVHPDSMSIEYLGGLITWVPKLDQAGWNDVAVRVEDGHGGSDEQVFEVWVNSNHAPEIVSMPETTATVGVRYTYPVVAIDDNGDRLVYSLLVAPEGMTIDSISGLVSWTPAAEQTGDTTVHVVVTDICGATDQQIYTITVEGVESCPVIVTYPREIGHFGYAWFYQAVLEDNSLYGTVRFSLAEAPEGMVICAWNGWIYWIPRDNQYGSFPVKAVASVGDCADTAAFTLRIDAPEPCESPRVVSTPDTTAYVSREYVHQIITDWLGEDSLTFALDTAPRGMTIDPASGTIRWTPEEDQIGYNLVNVRIDGATCTVWHPYIMVVQLESGCNGPVVTSVPDSTVNAGSQYRYQVVATHENDDVPVYGLTSGPEGMAIDEISGLVTWTPRCDQAGTAQASVEVVSGECRVTQEFAVLVNGGPSIEVAPIAQPHVSCDELWVTADIADENGVASATLHFRLDTTLDWRTLRMVRSDSSTWRAGLSTTQLRTATEVRFYVSATDSEGVESVSSAHTVGVTVNASAPRITSAATVSTPEREPFTYTATAEDDDRNRVTLEFAGLPEWVEVGGATISGTPDNDSLDCRFTVLADDGCFTDTLEVTVNVLNVNRPPVFVTDPDSLAQEIRDGETIDAVVTAVDPDEGDTVTYSFAPNAPAGITVDETTGAIDWTPGISDTGTHEVTVVATDRGGLTDTLVIEVEVVHVNHAPVFVTDADSVSTEIDAYDSLTITVLAIDPDSLDTVVYSLADGTPEGLTIDSATGEITWTPVNADSGENTVVIVAADPEGLTDTLVVTVTVLPVNRPPVFVTDPSDLPETVAACGSFAAQVNALDPDGDAVIYSLIPVVSPAITIDSVTGAIAWAPRSSEDGLHTIWVVARDPEGAADTLEFVLEVNAGFAPRLVSTAVDTAYAKTRYRYGAVAEDHDGDVVTFSFANLPSWLAVAGDSVVGTATNGDPDTSFLVAASDGCRADTLIVSLVVLKSAVPPEYADTADSLEETIPADEPYEDTIDVVYDDTGVVLAGRINLNPNNNDDFEFWMVLEDGTEINRDSLLASRGSLEFYGPVSYIRFKPKGNGNQNTLTVNGESYALRNGSLYTITADSLFVHLYNDGNGGASMGHWWLDNFSATSAILVEGERGDVRFYMGEPAPEGMTIDSITGVVRWLPASADDGDHAVTIVKKDGVGNLDTLAYTLHVDGANTAAVLVLDSVAGATDPITGRVTVHYSFSDAEGHAQRIDKLLYSVDNAATWQRVCADQVHDYRLPGTHQFSFESAEQLGRVTFDALRLGFCVADSRKTGWEKRSSLPSAAGGLAAAAIDDAIYAVGGAELRVYEVSRNRWILRTAMPTSRTEPAVAVLDGKLYAVGGYNGACLNTVEMYDPATDTWTFRAPMPTARRGLGLGAIGGKLYAVGGTNGGAVAAVESYDPVTDTWTRLAAMPRPREGMAVAVAGGRLYAIGGRNEVFLADVDAFDPAANTWSTCEPMPTRRSHLAAAELNGRIYAVGGYNAWSTVEEFDPATGTWAARAALPTRRNRLALATANDRLYAIGGWYLEALAAVEAYRPHLFSNRVVSTPFAIVNNHAPSCTIDPIASPQRDSVIIGYRLSDSDGDLLNVSLFFELGGQWWPAANVLGRTTGIARDRYTGTLVWLAGRELGGTALSSVRVKLVPADGNEGTAAVSNAFAIDNTPLPRVTEVLPAGSVPAVDARTITVQFSVSDIDESTITSSTISVRGSTSGALPWRYTLAGSLLTLTLNALPACGEDVRVTIGGDLRDLRGRRLDGNDDGRAQGSPADDFVALLTTSYAGDLDGDGLIGFGDLSYFSENWFNSAAGDRDSLVEMGPATGTMPNLVVEPDGVFDFEDLDVFIRMWHWSDAERARRGMARTRRGLVSEQEGSRQKAEIAWVGEGRDHLQLTLAVEGVEGLVACRYVVTHGPRACAFQGVERSPMLRERGADIVTMQSRIDEGFELNLGRVGGTTRGVSGSGVVAEVTLAAGPEAKGLVTVAYTLVDSAHQVVERGVIEAAIPSFADEQSMPEVGRVVVGPAPSKPAGRPRPFTLENDRDAVRRVMYDQAGFVLSFELQGVLSQAPAGAAVEAYVKVYDALGLLTAWTPKATLTAASSVDGSQRFTVYWDGWTGAGHPAAPGIYHVVVYYKSSNSAGKLAGKAGVGR